MEIWFSSDLHLGHENIIRFCNRPFSDAREMTEVLRENHNKLVKGSDHWYNLGDVTMERGGRVQREAFIKLVKSFNGHKRLLLGNHDHFPTSTYLSAGFEKIYATWRGIDNILLSHYPVHPSCMGTAKANAHGHIHDNVSPEPVVFKGYPSVWNTDSNHMIGEIKPYINLCVEWTDYRPITLGELNERITVRIKVEQEKESEDGKVTGL